ncbi:thioredoxin family protein [Heyndrickxia ginsengihumi]|uniref:Thioredoxin family protein n=1 Tax=Heyndrickxia ginsengihumi TaxID=363870 RepID=A0A6M0P959_9BACI|nr:thioredoxin family protein [Heyndrickxia ginsengihumi]MBE6185129.1 thioredoxin family protein [Bacillus sp. (in: firmicutes)]MCM3023788.1 thioredoxin family protein [Heyndrickxia ginsengihumi]NEY21274.1 thioredoxin family protein [Heyndrickxia ginsengihumi]
MNLNNWFEKGIPSNIYLSSMQVYKEHIEYILDAFDVRKKDDALFQKLREKQLRVIVLTEERSKDAMVNVPILLKIAAVANIGVRMLYRDKHTELVNQYLTNGSYRSIPMFIFIDKKGGEKAVWGPRAPIAQQIVNQLYEELLPKDDLQKTLMIGKIVDHYADNAVLWNDIYEDIVKTLQAIE